MKRIVNVVCALLAVTGLPPSPGFASPAENDLMRDLSSMGSSRAAHTITTLADGSALVVGGFIADEKQIAGVEVFDARRQQFRTIDNAIHPRHSHTASLLPDGRVLIAGGYDLQARYVDTAEVFDPATARFTHAGNMTVPRADHTAVVLADGRIAFIGGTSTGWTILDSIEIYDPKTGEISAAGRMSVPRMSHTSVLLSDGRVFIAGGRNGRGSTVQIYNSTETFDPSTGQSRPCAHMQTRRHKHDAIALADGRVLITGGSNEYDTRGRYDSAEIFDPTRNAFMPAAKMHMPRYKHRGSSLLLPNGKVLIAGGATQAEMYDPTTNTFALVTGESRLQGHFPAVALLPARRVLITGGYASPDSPSRGAWIYQF